MSEVTLIFPHQLFEKHPAISKSRKVILVEEQLFFKQFAFHKQKIAFHRATMKFYANFLADREIQTEYINAQHSSADVRILIDALGKQDIDAIHYAEVSDDWLRQRIRQSAERAHIKPLCYDSPLFLNTRDQLESYFEDQTNYRQTDFYIDQRKKRHILVDEHNKPLGGKWSFDADNRSKYPKGKQAPFVSFPEENDYYREAKEYVTQHFNNNYGRLSTGIHYPSTFKQSRRWLEHFLQQRFKAFGDYQDAMVRSEVILHHSVLTPMLNAGLLTPQEIIETTLNYADDTDIPPNTLEGFIRQIMGWREFIRAVYEREGRRERTMNFWGFDRNIPESFWNGTTGIRPVDIVIKRVLNTGYCHHIERLMVIGNFMLLCEFDPNEVYRWFMELFVDAYDWVMVPNVYGMSQFADGGLMATKPYISSSNYINKMSNFNGGPWETIWDSLFWRFMHVHRSYFEDNHRMGMLLHTFDKMDKQKQDRLISNADEFLDKL